MTALAFDLRKDLDWFPDWRGKACAIVASGRSAKTARLDLIRGRMPVIAIKECAVDLCPWADVAYGCDGPWWKHRRGLPGFKGLKIAWAPAVSAAYPDVQTIKVKELPKPLRGEDRSYVDRILTEEPGMIGSGRNSAFQALNLAVQFGANRVMLVGLDLHGKHYYGRNEWPKAGNPDELQFERCIRAFNDNAPLLKSLGVDVVNVSDRSALKCFRQSSIEQTIADWSL